MEVLILAGGLAKRLRPVSEEIPKCMVAIDGKPILDYQLAWLGKHGITKIVMACGYKWQQIRDRYGSRLVYSAESEPLGTGGAIRLALEKIDEEEFLVLNADDMTDIDLGAFIKSGANTTAVANFHSNFGIVDMNDGKITKFREKPLLPYWANCGLHLLSRKVKFPSKGSLEQDVLPKLAEKGELKAYRHPGFWKTVNTVKDLEEVEGFFRKK
jgi:NDP-sugar pyrophosphorylase family protein